VKSKKNSSNGMQERQSVSATPGEQVFGETADEFLVDKIVERTRENSSGTSHDSRTEKTINGSVTTGKRRGILGILAACAVLGGIAVLVVRSMTHKGKKTKRR
jgi:hypothetical protein